MANWQQLVSVLKTHGVEFSDPLTERETVSVENGFGFTFPNDLRAFLQTALPIGGHFPDWRSGQQESLAGVLSHSILRGCAESTAADASPTSRRLNVST